MAEISKKKKTKKSKASDVKEITEKNGIENEEKDEKRIKKGKKRKYEARENESNDEEKVEKIKKKKKKKEKKENVELEEETNGDIDAETLEEMRLGDLKNFPISPRTKELLLKRGVKYLFPVQSKSFDDVYKGNDVIAQARTGTGKTFSFAIPLTEKLKDIPKKSGRPPKVLVLAPTRELAKQVSEDFEAINDSLTVTCIYGGTAYWPQETAIRHGIDVLVGTPGRVLDYVRRKTLNLSQVNHVVLDEVDRMLDMGFADPVEEILMSVYKLDSEGEKRSPQTLLFSATLPKWVHDTAKKYMKPNTKRIDLIGGDTKRTATTVQHMAIKCGWKDRAATISDVIKVYSGHHGRSMVFCQTKKEANELAFNSVIKQEAQVLHGDIAQQQREITLRCFREGKVKCLVTTDVAARGLDIPEVELVIQCNPPKDVEDYIHRSGRTGRANRKGVCICFYKPNEEWELSKVEQKAGIKFKRIGAPQPKDIIQSSASDVTKFLDEVSDDVIDHFRPAAKTLLEERDAELVLAAALAHISGATDIALRSLLNSEEGYTTYLLEVKNEIRTASYVYQTIGSQLPYEVREGVKGVNICVDQTKAVFDVPSKFNKVIKENWKDDSYATLKIAAELPALKERDPYQSRGGGGYGNNRYSGGSGYGYRQNGYGRGGGRGFGGRGRGGRGGGRGFRGGGGGGQRFSGWWKDA